MFKLVTYLSAITCGIINIFCLKLVIPAVSYLINYGMNERKSETSVHILLLELLNVFYLYSIISPLFRYKDIEELISKKYNLKNKILLIGNKKYK